MNSLSLSISFFWYSSQGKKLIMDLLYLNWWEQGVKSLNETFSSFQSLFMWKQKVRFKEEALSFPLSLFYWNQEYREEESVSELIENAN